MTVFPLKNKAPYRQNSARSNINFSVTRGTRKGFLKGLEGLNIAKALKKLDVYQLVHKTVNTFEANKHVKKHDRCDVAIGLIASILAGARKTEEIVEYALAISSKLGLKSFPDRSNLSRILSSNMDSVLFNVFKRLSKTTLRFKGKLPFDTGPVGVIDSHPIITKAKIASKGYLKGRVTRGVKAHFLTVDGVPVSVLFSTANYHDESFLEDLLNQYRNVDHIVVDRAYIDLRLIAELAKKGKTFTSRTKGNVKTTLVEAFKEGDYIVLVSYRDVQGVKIRRYEVYNPRGEKVHDVITTLDDWKLAVQLYAFRWHIEVMFRHIVNLGFKPINYSYRGFSASILLYVIAYLIILLYGILAKRGRSITKIRDKFKRWFMTVYQPPKKPPNR